MRNIRETDKRRLYAESNPFTYMAFSALVVGVVGLVTPSVLRDFAIGDAVPRLLALVWVAFWLAGAVMVLVGVFWLSVRWEAAGLCLYASCCAAYSLAIFYERGVAPGVFAAGIFVGLCIASWRRAWLLIQGRELDRWSRAD